jgi:hypothetical protein
MHDATQEGFRQGYKPKGTWLNVQDIYRKRGVDLHGPFVHRREYVATPEDIEFHEHDADDIRERQEEVWSNYRALMELPPGSIELPTVPTEYHEPSEKPGFLDELMAEAIGIALPTLTAISMVRTDPETAGRAKSYVLNDAFRRTAAKHAPGSRLGRYAKIAAAGGAVAALALTALGGALADNPHDLTHDFDQDQYHGILGDHDDAMWINEFTATSYSHQRLIHSNLLNGSSSVVLDVDTPDHIQDFHLQNNSLVYQLSSYEPGVPNTGNDTLYLRNLTTGQTEKLVEITDASNMEFVSLIGIGSQHAFWLDKKASDRYYATIHSIDMLTKQIKNETDVSWDTSFEGIQRNPRIPVISPDGRFLAWAHDNESYYPPPYYDQFGDKHEYVDWNIWLKDRITNQTRKIATNVIIQRPSYYPALSINNRYLVWSDENGDTNKTNWIMLNDFLAYQMSTGIIKKLTLNPQELGSPVLNEDDGIVWGNYNRQTNNNELILANITSRNTQTLFARGDSVIPTSFKDSRILFDYTTFRDNWPDRSWDLDVWMFDLLNRIPGENNSPVIENIRTEVRGNKENITAILRDTDSSLVKDGRYEIRDGTTVLAQGAMMPLDGVYDTNYEKLFIELNTSDLSQDRELELIISGKDWEGAVGTAHTFFTIPHSGNNGDGNNSTDNTVNEVLLYGIPTSLAVSLGLFGSGVLWKRRKKKKSNGRIPAQ